MGELSLDEKAEILFFDQAFATTVVLATLYTITNTSEKNPDHLYRYDLRDPFNLQKGWLLWAGIGFIGALTAVSLSGAALALFNGEPPERETDALVRLFPLKLRYIIQFSTYAIQPNLSFLFPNYRFSFLLYLCYFAINLFM